jgi:hypothetical protein
MNKNNQCSECKYNTFKSKGGKGKICNGVTMEKYQRCPEWAINEYNSSGKALKSFRMSDVVEYMRIK